MRDGARPGKELFARLAIPGAVTLGHAIGAHGAPFVMVAFQPNLKQVRELSIVRYVARRQMAVIVEYRLLRRITTVQVASRLILEKKIVGYESHIVAISSK